MKLLAAIFLLMLVLTKTSPLLAAEPFARASLEESTRIVPGQQVHVVVDIFVPDFFTAPPEFPLFDIPDALVTLPDERAQNLVRTIDGVQYSGIRRRYVIVPEVPGRFVLPAIDIEFGYSADGRSSRGKASLPAISFTVEGDASARPQSIAFAARDLTITQSFDRDPSKLSVGDAIVRTITIFAKDTQAMLVPSVEIGQASGLKQYPKPPAIADGVAAGRETGSQRVETISYTADRSGSFVIPAVSYAWFDVDAHRQQISTLPSTTVSVAEAPARSERIAPTVDQTGDHSQQVYQIAIPMALVAALVVISLTVSVGREPARRLTGRLISRLGFGANSRRGEFRRLQATIRSGDRPSIYAGLQTWSRAEGFRTLATWSESIGNGELFHQIGLLQEELFGLGKGETFDKTRMLRAIGNGRASPEKRKQPMVLPPLNPVDSQ